jgi:hypothetical protein
MARDDGEAPRDKVGAPAELLPHEVDVKLAGDDIGFAILGLPTAWT